MFFDISTISLRFTTCNTTRPRIMRGGREIHLHCPIKAVWSIPLPNAVRFVRCCTLLHRELAMFGRVEVSDKQLLKTVNRRLDRTGIGSQSRVTASVEHGRVTLRGQLRYDNQRSPVVKSVQAVAGVRQVIDQLQSAPKTKPQSTEFQRRSR